MTKQLMKNLNQRPIVYYPIYRDITGRTTSGILLSQLMYWFSIGKDKIYKTDDELMQETHLTENELKTAKKDIRKLEFIEVTREGLPAKTYYEIDWEKYAESMSEEHGKIDSDQEKSKKVAEQVRGNPPNSTGEIHRTVQVDSTNHSYSTENTTENTTEIVAHSAAQFGKTTPAKKKAPAQSTLVFEAYKESMRKRYSPSLEIPRSAKVSSQLNNMIKRIGFDGAMMVASNFPFHNNSWYVKKMHSIDAMVKDCESLYMQVQVGRPITNSEAYEADKNAKFQNNVNTLIQSADDEMPF